MSKNHATIDLTAGFIVMAGMLTVGSASASADSVKTITEGKLTYCTSIGAAPYEYNDAGTIKGFVMDYMAELAKRMGKEAVIIDMPFDEIIAAVASGKCDVANATHTITAKREQQVTMVPFFAAGDQLLVRKGNPTGITGDPKLLCGKKFAVVLGQAETDEVKKWSDDCVAAGKPEIQSVVADSQPTAYQMLATGQAEAVFTDNAFAAYQVQTMPQHFELAGSAINVLPAGIDVAKENKAMADAVNTVVCSMRKDGTFFAIIKKWGIPESIDAAIPYKC